MTIWSGFLSDGTGLIALPCSKWPPNGSGRQMGRGSRAREEREGCVYSRNFRFCFCVLSCEECCGLKKKEIYKREFNKQKRKRKESIGRMELSGAKEEPVCLHAPTHTPPCLSFVFFFSSSSLLLHGSALIYMVMVAFLLRDPRASVGKRCFFPLSSLFINIHFFVCLWIEGEEEAQVDESH